MSNVRIEDGAVFLGDPEVIGQILRVKGFTICKGIQYLMAIKPAGGEVLIALVYEDGHSPQAIVKLEEVKFVIAKDCEVLIEILADMSVIDFTWSDAAIACWEEEHRRLLAMPLEERLWEGRPENEERLAMIARHEEQKRKAAEQK